MVMRMMFLFNEQSAVENMIKMNIVDSNHIFTTIKDLARYNYFVLNMNKDDNYNNILKYLKKNAKNINEEDVYRIIDDCVNRAKKYHFKSVREVFITKNELSFIQTLNDIKQEKIAFVLLASAKYYDLVRGTQNDTTYMKNSDICKLARVTVPAVDRDVFMQFAYDKGVLSRHSMAASTAKRVLFVSKDNSDKIVLRLRENDFKDLAYTYLSYISPHRYRRCVVCGRWIRRDSQGKQICKECSAKGITEKNTIKEIQCIDCGRSVYISAFDSQTNRCPQCYFVYRRKQKTQTMRELREKQLICGQTIYDPYTTK